jgi:hypothetical protein
MNVKYYLVENLLTERPDDYQAQVTSTASLDREAVIDRILKRGSLLTRTDILAVMNGIEETVADALLEGCTLNLPLFNTSFSISGIFDSPMDSFDGNRHKLNINLTKGTLLRETEKKIRLEKTAAHAPHPTIQEVKDSISGIVNEKLTAGGVVEIRGYNLRIEGDDPTCGLWFVGEDSTETKASVIIENKPAKVMAMIPLLPAGKYQIKTVTQYSNGVRLLKTPKIFSFPKMLTVPV